MDVHPSGNLAYHSKWTITTTNIPNTEGGTQQDGLGKALESLLLLKILACHLLLNVLCTLQLTVSWLSPLAHVPGGQNNEIMHVES